MEKAIGAEEMKGKARKRRPQRAQEWKRQQDAPRYLQGTEKAAAACASFPKAPRQTAVNHLF